MPRDEWGKLRYSAASAASIGRMRQIGKVLLESWKSEPLDISFFVSSIWQMVFRKAFAIMELNEKRKAELILEFWSFQGSVLGSEDWLHNCHGLVLQRKLRGMETRKKTLFRKDMQKRDNFKKETAFVCLGNYFFRTGSSVHLSRFLRAILPAPPLVSFHSKMGKQVTMFRWTRQLQRWTTVWWWVKS